MGKHHRRSHFARNAAAFTATVAGVSALAVPSASANPLNELQGFLGDSPALPNAQEFIGGIGQDGALSAAPVSTGAQIVDAARSKVGSPYVWGATGPSSFDCSGLTTWAYSQVGKSIPRTSQQQAASGTPVSSPALGDIVAFYSGATHVGIFSGNDNVIHAPQSGDVVKEAPMNYMPVHSIVRF